ncbi:MAG: glycoside hydrolase family 3 N-terminal domain-containing protein, partial [Robiginitalea sp.]|nr:glycoside hydrolase family 3 N-terminal domain-containing protein [Robiginitalea sp.]
MHKLPTYLEVKGTLSRKDKLGQSFMPAAFINDSEEHIRALEELIRTQGIGGLCFFHSRASAAANFEGKQEVTYHPDSLQRLKELIGRYQEAAPYPLLIAIDAEWGLAMRVEQAPQYPYAATLGALKEASESLIYEVGLSIARDCRDAGIHWNFAPVVDINTNPDNPVIGFRAFGNHPGDV